MEEKKQEQNVSNKEKSSVEKASVNASTEKKEQKQEEKSSKQPTKPYKIETDEEVLRIKSRHIHDEKEIAKLAAKLKTVIMTEDNAIGIAAVQLGIHYRMFAMLMGTDAHKDKTEDRILIVINPEIKKLSTKTGLYREGCLSEPNIVAVKERAKKVKAKFTTLEGRTITTTFSGTDAIVFQHEYDHLDGKLMKDNAKDILDN